MKRPGQETTTPPTLQQIFENLIFLEKIFDDNDDEEISDIPFLELARSFELNGPSKRLPAARRGDQ